jgi:hypothetical protein
MRKHDITFKMSLTGTGVSCEIVASVVVDGLSNIANFFLSKSEG